VDEVVLKKDLEGLEQKIEQLTNEQRRTRIEIIEEIDKSSSKIISMIFSESKEIREEIGYQAIILKTLEDNLSGIQFDQETGVSSKIEVSVGGEIFGTGAKWVLDIDTSKASYKEILEAIQHYAGISEEKKEWVKSKIEKLLR
jgi:hypothetical protein